MTMKGLTRLAIVVCRRIEGYGKGLGMKSMVRLPTTRWRRIDSQTLPRPGYCSICRRRSRSYAWQSIPHAHIGLRIGRSHRRIARAGPSLTRCATMAKFICVYNPLMRIADYDGGRLDSDACNLNLETLLTS